VQISTFEPAAGEEGAMPAEETVPAAGLVVPAVEGDAAIGEVIPPVAVVTDSNGCLLNEAGEQTFDEQGNCVKPAPVVEGAAPAVVTAPAEGAPMATEGESVE
jgi:hypothetical protein